MADEDSEVRTMKQCESVKTGRKVQNKVKIAQDEVGSLYRFTLG